MVQDCTSVLRNKIFVALLEEKKSMMFDLFQTQIETFSRNMGVVWSFKFNQEMIVYRLL